MPFCLLSLLLATTTRSNKLALALSIVPPKKLYLAKTKETFKFADLQLLQAQWDATNWNQSYHCKRLVLDSATGSSLLLLEFNSSDDSFDASNKQNKLPPSLARCEWVGEILAQSTDATTLVQLIRKEGGIKISDSCAGGWTMDYVRMIENLPRATPPQTLNYNLKTLLCSLAQQVTCPAVLDPSDAAHELIVVETMRQGIYLAQNVKTWEEQDSSRWQQISSSWAKRPFQYSSAIHPTVAEILVEIVLLASCSPDGDEKSSRRRTTRFWDPTCGSGSFLAFALACCSAGHDIFVEGWDVNRQCVEGTKANVEYAFGSQLVSTNCVITVKDSSLMKTDDDNDNGDELVDCLIANLPWGMNTVDYVDQNLKILESIRTRLKDDVPAVFVHKNDDISNPKTLKRLGYELVGEAFVPPLDFAVPKSRKKKKCVGNDEEDDEQENTNRHRCQRITLTRAIRCETS